MPLNEMNPKHVHHRELAGGVCPLILKIHSDILGVRRTEVKLSSIVLLRRVCCALRLRKTI